MTNSKSTSVFNLSPSSIYNIIQAASRRAGIDILRPHDCRRSYAKLSHEGGASLEQIRLTLGHSSLITTQRYLGSSLATKPGEACGDHIVIEKE